MGKQKTYRYKNEVDPLQKESFTGPGPTDYNTSRKVDNNRVSQVSIS